MEVADSLLDLIGDTPLLRLGRTGRDLECDLLAKLEMFNPGGSVKDRPAVAMLDAAERDGLLPPGGTIIEPTSGNTGVGLAIVAAQRGYRCIFVMSDKMSEEKVSLLRAYGAEVIVCPTAVPPEHPDSYYSVADRLTRETPNSFRPNQYANPANPAEHERSTGPEIWRQTGGRVTHFVAGIGTGGTITGVARVPQVAEPGDPDHRRRSRRAPCTPAAPAGPISSKVSARTSGPRPTTRRSSTARSMVSDAESFAAARRVTLEEGLLIGGSCGTAVHAALGRRRGARTRTRWSSCCCPTPGAATCRRSSTTTGCSTSGFIRGDGPTAGDVLAAKDDAIAGARARHSRRDGARRDHDSCASSACRRSSCASPRSRRSRPKEVAGTLRELELMDLAFRDPAVLERPVGEVMEPAAADGRDRRAGRRHGRCLEQGPSVLVLDGGHPIGMLTRSDVLSFLAERAPRRRREPVEATGSRRARSTRARRPTRRPARSSPPISARDDVRAGSGRASTAATSTRRSGNPTRPRSRRVSRRSRAPRTGSRSRAGWPRRTRCCARSSPGDHVIIPTDAYGGTFRLVARVHERPASRGRAADLDDPDALAAAWRDETAAGVDRVADQPGAGDRRHRRGRRARARARRARRRRQHVRHAVPATAARARRRRVVHSTHEVPRWSLRRRRRLRRRSPTPSSPTSVRFLQNAMGAVPSPFDCYLVLRGVKTLARPDGPPLRERAAIVGDARTSTRRSRGCCIPGCPSTPGTTSRARQMRDFGGMVSFLAAGGEDAALEIVARDALCSRSPSRSARSSRSSSTRLA